MKTEKIICKICKKEFLSIRSLFPHLIKHRMTSNEYYDLYFKNKYEGICYCGKVTRFDSFTNGYRIYCSSKCAASSIEIKQKIKDTNISKYGETHYNKTQHAKDKFVKTSQIKYGVDNPFQSDKIKIKIKKTINRIYGVDNISQSEVIKNKKKETLLYNFGVDSPMKNDDIKERSKKTCLRVYGFEFSSRNLEVKNKKKQTFFKKFGGFTYQSVELMKKVRDTNIKIYGVIHPMKSKEVQNKYKHTCIDRYGEDNWAKTDDGRRNSRDVAVRYREAQLENNEPLMPRVGDMERPALNELQLYTGYKILRQDQSFRNSIVRFPDGHILEIKLIILFDEPGHFEDKGCTILNKSSLCESRDYKSLEGYSLFRISQIDWINDNHNMIEQFKEIIKWQKEQL
jgi:hypothetical protein